MSTYLSLDLIEATAKDAIADLEREALRTIRQRNQEKGVAVLQEIEGVEMFLDQLRIRAGSEISKRNGDVIEQDVGNTKVVQRISELRRRRMG